MRIEIKCRFSGRALFGHDIEGNTTHLTVEAAVRAGANLSDANLGDANLRGANLRGAYLVGAYLVGANLDGANLRGANLDDANLGGAYLGGAYLGGAYLGGANLDGAYLDGAYLGGANLDGANLRGANLDGAYLDGEVLSKAPVSLLNLRWPVLITEGFMRIGCQRHTHSEWAAFDDAAISRMDSNALAFWLGWKEPLLALCAAHRGKGGD